MPVDYEVHKVERIPGTTQTRVIKVTPYVRLCGEGQPPLFVQGGQVFSAEGAEAIAPEALPPWFWSEAERVSPQVKAETGLDRLLKPAQPTRAATPEILSRAIPSIGMWRCLECQQEMPTRAKGLHVARHRRAAKKPKE